MRSIALHDGETVIVNGALLRVPIASEVIVENNATVLRGDEIMTADQAVTPARRLYVACLQAYLGRDVAAQHARIVDDLRIVLAEQSDDTARVVSVRFANAVAACDYVRGLCECRTLIAQEDASTPASATMLAV